MPSRAFSLSPTRAGTHGSGCGFSSTRRDTPRISAVGTRGLMMMRSRVPGEIRCGFSRSGLSFQFSRQRSDVPR